MYFNNIWTVILNGVCTSIIYDMYFKILGLYFNKNSLYLDIECCCFKKFAYLRANFCNQATVFAIIKSVFSQACIVYTLLLYYTIALELQFYLLVLILIFFIQNLCSLAEPIVNEFQKCVYWCIQPNIPYFKYIVFYNAIAQG